MGYQIGLETWVSAGAAVAFLGERLVGKRGSPSLAGAGFMLFLAAFAFGTGAGMVIFSFFMMAVLINYLEPLMEAYLNEWLRIRATMLSVFSMLISAGMIITFSLIGFLADWLGLSDALKTVWIVWVPVCLAVMLCVKACGKKAVKTAIAIKKAEITALRPYTRRSACCKLQVSTWMVQ